LLYGYFFLSGFSLLKDHFPEDYNKLPFLKIVMGNETTLSTKEELVEGYSLKEIIKQKMIEELQQDISEKQVNQLRTLSKLIAHDIIEIRLFDKAKLHAKMYLFLTHEDEDFGSPGLGVVGSSNFTKAGLTKNRELNVVVTSRNDFIYLDNWFDELWNDAIEFNEDLLKVIDVSGVLPESNYPKTGKILDPITLFKYFVYHWFGDRVLNLLEKDILMEFQVVGVINAVKILNYYNGVILADSVGLGKSFMASAIIEEFLYVKHPTWLDEEKKIPSVLLILPPSLIAQWEDLLIGKVSDYLGNTVFEQESIESNYFLKNNSKKVIEDRTNIKTYSIYNDEKIEIGKIKFLSLGVFQTMDDERLKELSNDYDLFVIDESHKYRNKTTNRWKNVRKLQKKENGFENKFILLTATPLNNSINDIYNAIKLFTDDTSAPFGVKGILIDELIKKYEDFKREYERNNDLNVKKELRKVAIDTKQKILNEIMVLRTRRYIKTQFADLKVNGKPLVFKDPKPYSLDYSPFNHQE